MVTCYVKMYTKLKRTTTASYALKTLHKSNLERKTKKTKIKMSGIHVENKDLRALVLLASSSDSFGNLREEIEQETRDDATTEILHRIQSNAVCVV